MGLEVVTDSPYHHNLNSSEFGALFWFALAPSFLVVLQCNKVAEYHC